MGIPEDEIEIFPDGIGSKDAKVDNWLKLTYIILPIWGLVTFYLYWNGSQGWLDRGYWRQLQKAANTTFPQENINDPHIVQQLEEEKDTMHRPTK